MNFGKTRARFADTVVRFILCLRTIAGQKLRYPKMITQHVLSELTELVLNDRKICHS